MRHSRFDGTKKIFAHAKYIRSRLISLKILKASKPPTDILYILHMSCFLSLHKTHVLLFLSLSHPLIFIFYMRLILLNIKKPYHYHNKMCECVLEQKEEMYRAKDLQLILNFYLKIILKLFTLYVCVLSLKRRSNNNFLEILSTNHEVIFIQNEITETETSE